MPTRILDTDGFQEVAKKIFKDFDLNQSCTVTGWVQFEDLSTKPKGEMVLKELERLDSVDNIRPAGKRMVRRRKRWPDSIGDYIAGKAFRWKKVIVDNEVKYTIWRTQ
jgi:hypothetical protein